MDQICPKRAFPVESRKSEHHHWILYIRISLHTKFQLKLTFLFFGSNYPKKPFPVKNRKSEHRHWILHIRISLGTKFHFRQTTLKFGTKFAQKGYFRSKVEEVNIAIEFCILELLYIPNFSLNWQFLFFGPNFPNKSVSGQKLKKRTPR